MRQLTEITGCETALYPAASLIHDKLVKTKQLIDNCVRRLKLYTHNKLVAEMDFGFWRYLFAQPQFHFGGSISSPDLSGKANKYEGGTIQPQLRIQ